MFAKRAAYYFLLLPLLICVAGKEAHASELGPIDLSGFVAIETRSFTQDPRHSGQQHGSHASFIVQPEFRYRTEDRNHQFSFIPFYRHDTKDDTRTHFDVREAYWLWLGDEWELLTGINKVFWGVAESRHLVNVINQIDGVEDLDGEDYLGQPMVNLATQRDWGRVDLYVLPGFRERTFPGRAGRFRTATPVDNDTAIYESGSKRQHVDVAARYSHFIGDWDVGLSYFHGTGREPTLSLNDGGTALTARYELINQWGLDLQYTRDAWLWKLETIAREGQGDMFGAVVGGFEYTFYQIAGQNWDLGILAEYQHDGRDETAPSTGQDEDVFAGLRLALNDIQDSELLAGMSVDHNSGEQFYNIEAQRRIGSQYELELRARFFAGSDAGNDSFAFENDDYIQLRFSRYF